MDPQRMFLAVRPSAVATAELHRLARPEGTAVRWEDPANWHITLRFLSRAPVDEVIAAIDGLRPIGAPIVVLGPAVAILGKGVVIVPARGLDGLAAALAGVTGRFTAATERDVRHPFTGHLTLGRLRRGNRTCGLVGHRVDATFVADGLDLVVSTPHAGGHRHDVVHRWGLPYVSAA